MSVRQRRAVAQTAWRLLVLLVLALAAGWDAIGLLVGGDAAYTGSSYDVLRRLTPWGMRAYGPALLVLLAVTVFAFDRYSTSAGRRGYALLRWCLALLAAWYTMWALGITGAWWIHREVLSWGAVGKLALTSAVCLVLARTTPDQRVT